MRFITPYLESIDGVAIYPIISILIFFTLFLIIGIRVIRMDKNFINKMSNIPLSEDEEIKKKKYKTL